MGTSGFNANVAATLAGLSYRQLDYWDRSRFIRPSIRAASGHGSRRVYAFEDLVELRVAAGLREWGVSLQALRRAVAWLRKHRADLARPLASLRFLTDGKRLFSLT